jgi:prevent-host-death family protein
MSEDATWTVAEAKAKFSELVETAGTTGPQTITRNGRQTAVVVSIEEWERKIRRQGSLAEFFGSSPLPDSHLDDSRDGTGPRPLDL